MEFPTPLVTTEWLAAHLSHPNVRILDGSWYLPQSERDARSEYERGHIPGAVFCDLEAISDPDTPLPHMLPSPEFFARQAGLLGIGDDTFVVVYDGSGLNMTAPRIWWMFRAFGHQGVAVLDGGFKKWRAEGRAVEAGMVAPVPRDFHARPSLEVVRSMEEMRANLNSGREQVLDARSRGRFQGRDPEPRPGLRSGNIPGSYNLPYQELVAKDGTLLSPAELRARYAAAGIDLARPVVTSCGSGVTACALLLGLRVLGSNSVALYDGSWSEWGSRP
jgi:thiosulfate/3-mercaptopyruvate sulfurtransferase